MQVALLFDAAKNAGKRKRGEPTAALKNPQDYLKAILAKEPDRVKGIRAARLLRYMSREKELEARGGIEPPIMVLQTIALPLGDRATGESCQFSVIRCQSKKKQLRVHRI